jgi:hypothetical protein
LHGISKDFMYILGSRDDELVKSLRVGDVEHLSVREVVWLLEVLGRNEVFKRFSRIEFHSEERLVDVLALRDSTAKEKDLIVVDEREDGNVT